MERQGASEREERETAAGDEEREKTDSAHTTLHGLYLKIVCVCVCVCE